MGDLEAVAQQNASLASHLGINLPEDYTASICAYVDKNKTLILSDTARLQTEVKLTHLRAKQDRSALEFAANLLDDAMALYFTAAAEVTRVGSLTLTRLLDELLRELEALKVFLQRKEWQKFKDGVQVVMGDLQMLHDNARDYANSPGVAPEEQPLSDPYRCLGVTAEMTDDQIKQVYRNMCHIYHPDKQKVTNDSKSKELQVAFEQIRRERHF